MIAKQHGTGCRLVGKQLTVPQKFGPSVNSVIAESGEHFIMQPGGLSQMFDQAADHRTLFECKRRINMFRRIKRRSPAGSGIMSGDKSQPENTAQRGKLPAQRRLIEKIALPGTFATGAQAIFIHTGIAELIFNSGGPLAQDLIEGAVDSGAINPGPERKRPPIIEPAKTVTPVTAEEVNGYFKQAAEGELHGILGYEERPLVSVDYVNDPRSSIVDALSTMVINETQVKIYAWYDNEWGYVNRMMELSRMVAQDL